VAIAGAGSAFLGTAMGSARGSPSATSDAPIVVCQCAVGGSTTATLRIANVGSTVVYYRLDGTVASPLRAVRSTTTFTAGGSDGGVGVGTFSCGLGRQGTLLPGAVADVVVAFTAAAPGVAREQWTVHTTPTLVSGVAPTFILKGVAGGTAGSDDTLAPRRQRLEARLREAAVYASMRELVLELVDAAQSEPPAADPAVVARRQRVDFERNNRSLHYKPAVAEQLLVRPRVLHVAWHPRGCCDCAARSSSPPPRAAYAPAPPSQTLHGDVSAGLIALRDSAATVRGGALEATVASLSRTVDRLQRWSWSMSVMETPGHAAAVRGDGCGGGGAGYCGGGGVGGRSHEGGRRRSRRASEGRGGSCCRSQRQEGRCRRRCSRGCGYRRSCWQQRSGCRGRSGRWEGRCCEGCYSRCQQGRCGCRWHRGCRAATQLVDCEWPGRRWPCISWRWGRWGRW